MLQCSHFQNVRSRLPPSSQHFSISGLAAVLKEMLRGCHSSG